MPPTSLRKEGTRERCSTCGKSREDAKQMDRHHTNYERDEWISLCQECHAKVHDTKGFYDELAPEESRFW